MFHPTPTLDGVFEIWKPNVSNIEAHLYTEEVGGRYNYKTISSLHLHFHLKPKNLPVIRLSLPEIHAWKIPPTALRNEIFS